MEYENKNINNYNTKFHPDMANRQRNIDRHTYHPMDVSNAPPDADHDFNYREDYCTEAPNKKKDVNLKKSSKIKKMMSKIKKWFNIKIMRKNKK